MLCLPMLNAIWGRDCPSWAFFGDASAGDFSTFPPAGFWLGLFFSGTAFSETLTGRAFSSFPLLSGVALGVSTERAVLPAVESPPESLALSSYRLMESNTFLLFSLESFVQEEEVPSFCFSATVVFFLLDDSLDEDEDDELPDRFALLRIGFLELLRSLLLKALLLFLFRFLSVELSEVLEARFLRVLPDPLLRGQDRFLRLLSDEL